MRYFGKKFYLLILVCISFPIMKSLAAEESVDPWYHEKPISNEISQTFSVSNADDVWRKPLPAETTSVNNPDEKPRKIERVYYSDGGIQSETNLFSDKNNGFYKTFHKNGQLETELRYKEGWLVYDQAFDQKWRSIFRNGMIKTYYANGNLYTESEYKNNRRNGIEKIYYYDGKTLVDVWHYLNGRQAGIHIRNDANGNFVFEEDWGYPAYYVIGLFLTKDIEVTNIKTFSPLEERPNTCFSIKRTEEASTVFHNFFNKINSIDNHNAFNEEKVNKALKLVIWGLLILVVLLSVFILVFLFFRKLGTESRRIS